VTRMNLKCFCIWEDFLSLREHLLILIVISTVKNFIISSINLHSNVGVNCITLMLDIYVGISYSLLLTFLKLVGSIMPSEGLRDLRFEFNK